MDSLVSWPLPPLQEQLLPEIGGCDRNSDQFGQECSTTQLPDVGYVLGLSIKGKEGEETASNQYYREMLRVLRVQILM